MAHEIEEINGVAQMAYTGQVPWHGLGTELDEDVSSEDMMKAAGLDWTVKARPTYIRVGNKVIPTGSNALIRETDNTVLTQVGPNWKPCQNSEAFEFFNDFVEKGDMKMHTAGSLKNGQIVWALAKVNEGFELFGGDKVDSYLLFTNPHQYGKVIDIRFTPIRVVCNNTLTASLNASSKGEMKVNHRRAFDAETVKETLGIATERLTEYKTVAELLGAKTPTKEELDVYFMTIFGQSAKTNELSRTAKLAKKVMYEQPGHEFAEGSWWQAYNAVTYMTDHVLGRSVDTRLESAWYGANRKKKHQAMDVAMKMVAI